MFNRQWSEEKHARRRKRLMSLGIVALLLVSLAMFFLYPHYNYVSKLMYLVILIAFGVWHYMNRNLKAVFLCSFGIVFVLTTLVHSRTFKFLEVILVLAGWGIATAFERRRSQSDD